MVLNIDENENCDIGQIMSRVMRKKVQVDNDLEMAQSEKRPTPKTEVGKTKLTIRYLY